MRTFFYTLAALSFIGFLFLFVVGMVTSDYTLKVAGVALPFVALLALYFGDHSRG